MNEFQTDTVRKGPKTGLSIGASSVLIIFIIICLVTFSVLSLVSASADYKLSKKVADRNQAYYTATSHAQEHLAELSKAPHTDTEMVEFDEPINEKQHLHVVAMFPADSSGEEITILSWQIEKN